MKISVSLLKYGSTILFLALIMTLGAQTSPTSGTIAADVKPAPTPGKWQQFWLDRVEEFKAENKNLDPAKKNIVFLGDSLTQGFKLKIFFPELPVLNRGIVSDGIADFPGSKTNWRGITNRMKESLFDCNPSHVFLLIGTNDVGSGIALEYWFDQYKKVIAQTRQKFPDVKIIIVTCPPSGEPYKRVATLNPQILKWNEMIKKYAAEEKFRVIDLYALLANNDGILPPELTRDGLHFNQTGYERWAEAIRPILREDGVIK
ncbi:MAG TPA: GDSL-type esterase/lipase family protein [Candidatus Sumerlaeia bacterium]|nr:MAG: GDSL-like Lipase/Acylhydrolase [candidate division BRC1 bacterium ADurb.Bin183]HRR30370.1 GDSL-type esterase/lipase family protein [Candidatus Sumerlaeia bacterium]